ncbi:MAG: hypothetical protein AAF683_10600 [Pseudomonadota bacterium]
MTSDDLITALMAELTCRFEQLAARSVAFHTPGALDPAGIAELADQSRSAALIAETVDQLCQERADNPADVK